MTIIRYYAPNEFDDGKTAAILKSLQQLNPKIVNIKTEKCYHIEINDSDKNSTLDAGEILQCILKRPQHEGGLRQSSSLNESEKNTCTIEIGPRFNFSTAQSTNSVSICKNVGLTEVKRLEVSIKYLLFVQDVLSAEDVDNIFNTLGDKMTQCRYTADNYPINSFDEQLPAMQESWYKVPLMQEGRTALEKVNKSLGLSFDEWDLQFYTNLFQNVLKRDPTSVELFDCAQSNSEHSRHWFFKGKMVIDGIVQEKSLIRMIIDTQNHSNKNNTIKFSDNSSALVGFEHKSLRPTNVSGPGKFQVGKVKSDLIFTAETHNMPTRDIFFD